MRCRPRLPRTLAVLLWLYVPALLGIAGALLYAAWYQRLPS
jgi:hypothetical protein